MSSAVDLTEDSDMPEAIRYSPTPESSSAQASRTTPEQVLSCSDDEQAGVIREQLRAHKGQLPGLLGERLTDLIQVLLLNQVLAPEEADQVRRKQRRHQRAASLLDIVSRKNGTDLKIFIDALKAKCPRAYAILNIPEPAINESSSPSKVNMLSLVENCKRALEQCLSDNQHGLHRFYQELKSGLANEVDVTLVTFDNGFNLLHQLINLDRQDLLLSISYAGIWRLLCDMPAVCNTRQYAGLTPMDLALKLKRTKFRDSMSEINKNEIAMYEIERCVRDGNIARFRDLMDTYIKRVKGKSPEENSLLEYACQSGSLPMLEDIIKMEKEKLPCKRKSLNKALALSVDLGHYNLIQPLLEYLSVDINRVIVDGKSLTERAACNGDTLTFRHLESLGAMPRDAVIALAASNNRLPFLEDLLNGPNRRSYSLNFQDKRGKSAAHFAAEKCYTEVVRLLLSKGLELSLRDKRGFSILHAAASGGSLSTVEVVLEACRQKECLDTMLDARDRYLGPERCFLVRGRDNEQPAWHYVEANRGVIDVFQRRTQGGSVDVANYGIVLKSGWGSNPSVEMIQEVEKRYDALNADPNAPADLQALHVAIIKKREEVALKLISIMDNVCQADRFGLTPLHLAAMRGFVTVIEALLAKGASRTVTDDVGRKPVDISRANDHPAAVTSLTTIPQQNTADVRQILSDALHKLSDENVDRHHTQGQDSKLYIKMILRDVVADINEYLYDHLGEGPIASESAPRDGGLHNGTL